MTEQSITLKYVSGCFSIVRDPNPVKLRLLIGSAVGTGEGAQGSVVPAFEISASIMQGRSRFSINAIPDESKGLSAARTALGLSSSTKSSSLGVVDETSREFLAELGITQVNSSTVVVASAANLKQMNNTVKQLGNKNIISDGVVEIANLFGNAMMVDFISYGVEAQAKALENFGQEEIRAWQRTAKAFSTEKKERARPQARSLKKRQRGERLDI